MMALHAALASTLFMTGLVWFCQVVGYPLLGPDRQREHMVRTLPLVTIPMIVEMASAVALAASPLRGTAVQAAVALGLVVAIWAWTLAFIAPYHFSLARRFDPAVHGALVRANWLRTLAWSARAALLVWMLAVSVR